MTLDALLVGMYEGATALENCFSFKTKIEPTTQPNNFSLGLCPGEMKTCIDTKSFTNQATRIQPPKLHPARDSKRAEDRDAHPVCTLCEETGRLGVHRGTPRGSGQLREQREASEWTSVLDALVVSSD